MVLESRHERNSLLMMLKLLLTTNGLEYNKKVGPGYNGAALFSGVNTGAKARMRVH